MNQATYGDFLGYQEFPGMICNTTRLHITWLQEVQFLKISKISSEMLTRAHMYIRIWNMGWTQLESTFKIMLVWIENFHSDTIWFLKYGFPRIRAHLLEDPLISETCTLEDSTLHHVLTCSIRAKHGQVRSTLQRIAGNHKMWWFDMSYGHKNDLCSLW